MVYDIAIIDEPFVYMYVKSSIQIMIFFRIFQNIFYLKVLYITKIYLIEL